MRRFPAWLAAAAILLAATACGDGSTGAAPTPTVTVPPKPLKQATPAQLKAALPTLADLPKGWGPNKVDSSSDDDLIQGCPAFDDAEPEAPEAEADFLHPSAQLFSVLAHSHKSVAEAGVLVDSLRVMLRECPSFRSKDPSGTVTRFSLSVVSPPKVGDAAFALALDVIDPEFRGTLNLVAVRIRNHTLLLLGGRVGKAADGGAEMDPKLFEQLARLTVAKAQRVLPKA